MDKKKVGEIVLVSGMLAISLTAESAATQVASSSVAQSVAVAAGGFVVQAFNLNLSAHTAMSYDASSTTAAQVKTMNSKGMHSFAGTTSGGSIGVCETTSIAFAAPGTSLSTTTGC